MVCLKLKLYLHFNYGSKYSIPFISGKLPKCIIASMVSQQVIFCLYMMLCYTENYHHIVCFSVDWTFPRMPTQENISDSMKRLSAYKNKGKDSDVSRCSFFAFLSDRYRTNMPVIWLKLDGGLKLWQFSKHSNLWFTNLGRCPRVRF